MNKEFSDIEQYVIDQIKTAKKHTRNQQTLLALLNLNEHSDDQAKAFNALLDAFTSIERSKRAIASSNKKIRDIQRAQSQQTRKERTKKMIDVCADLMKINIVDSNSADYAVERLALLGFLLKFKAHLTHENSEYEQYVHVAQDYLNALEQKRSQ